MSLTVHLYVFFYIVIFWCNDDIQGSTLVYFCIFIFFYDIVKTDTICCIFLHIQIKNNLIIVYFTQVATY